MKNISIIVKNEILKYIRQPMVIIFAVLFPSFWIWISQEIYTNNASNFLGGYGTINYMFPAYCSLIFFVTGLSSLPSELTNNREKNVLLKYSFTSLNKYQYIISLLFSNWIINTLSIIIMYIIARVLSNLYVPNLKNILMFILSTIITQTMICSIGIILSNLLHGFKNVLYSSLMIYFISMFISGATIPLQSFPKKIINISNVFPFTYSIKIMRYFWLGVTFKNQNIIFIVITLITLLLLFISVKTFTWKSTSKSI